jgi:hypothetical protein
VACLKINAVVGFKQNYLFAVIGDFVEDKTDPPRVVNVVVGRPFKLHCPSHALSQNVKYNWFYMEGDVRQTLPPDENYFIGKNGTLYFSVMHQKDIDFINDNGGILCQQLAEPKGAASQSKQSIKLTLTSTGTEGIM